MFKKLRLLLLPLLFISAAPIAAFAANEDVPSAAMPLQKTPRSEKVQRLLDMEHLDTDVVIDAVSQDGQTIKVKRGSVVQLKFSQPLERKIIWWFAGLSPSDKSFVMLLGAQYVPRDSNGQVAANASDYATFTYVAETSGKWKLTFKHGPRVPLEEQLNQVPDRIVEVIVEVD